MSDLDLIRLDKELRHYKSQLAGKWGRFRKIMANAQRLTEQGYPNPHWQAYELHALSMSMASIGLKYLALRERIEEAS